MEMSELIKGTIQIKIETYWNVNPRGYYTFLDGITIKIETYWNVNTKSIKTTAGAASN